MSESQITKPRIGEEKLRDILSHLGKGDTWIKIESIASRATISKSKNWFASLSWDEAKEFADGDENILKSRPDYLSQKAAEQEHGVHSVSANLKIVPSQQIDVFGFPVLQGCQLADLPISENQVRILGVTIVTTSPDSAYRFIIFDRKQKSEHLEQTDVVFNEESKGQRTRSFQPKLRRYTDVDGCGNLHCAILFLGHPTLIAVFGKPDAQKHFSQPVSYSITVQYRARSARESH